MAWSFIVLEGHVYIRPAKLWGRQLGGFTMAKVTKKAQDPNPDVDQLTPRTKERK
jgi:hypothetical protein